MSVTLLRRSVSVVVDEDCVVPSFAAESNAQQVRNWEITVRPVKNAVPLGDLGTPLGFDTTNPPTGRCKEKEMRIRYTPRNPSGEGLAHPEKMAQMNETSLRIRPTVQHT